MILKISIPINLKLRKWNQPGDIDYVHLDGIDTLNLMKKIRDIFCGDGFPKEKCVHIIITVPEPETTPVEDRKELHHLRKIVEPKRMKAIAGIVDINTATLDMHSELICKRYPEYEDSTLLFKLHESITCTPETNDVKNGSRVSPATQVMDQERGVGYHLRRR
ncbi:hypothetical protein L211DRAFT_845555 [Terfezia boudieri ATCC MYA-4762]|uniref:Uncharacterized protein n=1 Tax=Terfezia boudieri ATCC MYA-4762 TaxID=1051890 RepID=A0A3N4M3G3_9PEZI|nr:hypothetical protein L211DRAFT_845555 [Terfezia boudieri ATCC MYA-4762]